MVSCCGNKDVPWSVTVFSVAVGALAGDASDKLMREKHVSEVEKGSSAYGRPVNVCRVDISSYLRRNQEFVGRGR